MGACPRLPTRTAAPPPVPMREACIYPEARQRAGRVPRRREAPPSLRALGGRRDWVRGGRERPPAPRPPHPAHPHPHRHQGKTLMPPPRQAAAPPRPPSGRQRAAIAALPPPLPLSSHLHVPPPRIQVDRFALHQGRQRRVPHAAGGGERVVGRVGRRRGTAARALGLGGRRLWRSGSGFALAGRHDGRPGDRGCGVREGAGRARGGRRTDTGEKGKNRVSGASERKRKLTPSPRRPPPPPTLRKKKRGTTPLCLMLCWSLQRVSCVCFFS